MSAYCTVQDLIDIGAMPEADIDALHTANPTMIPRLIESVSGVIDTWLRKRYKLPLKTPYPPELVTHTVTLVTYKLYQKRGMDYGDPFAVSLKEDQDASWAWCKNISTGDQELAGDQDASPGLDEAGPLISSTGSPYAWLDQKGGGYYSYKWGKGCGY